MYQGCRYIEDEPYGYLVGRVAKGAADVVEPLHVGSGAEFPFAFAEGARLSLRINDIDRCLVDNAGAVTVTVTTFPTGG
jgi:hypothetical protein